MIPGLALSSDAVALSTLSSIELALRASPLKDPEGKLDLPRTHCALQCTHILGVPTVHLVMLGGPCTWAATSCCWAALSRKGRSSTWPPAAYVCSY